MDTYILEKWASLTAVTRLHSIDWFTGCFFNPVFFDNGKLLTIYTQSDKSLKELIRNKILNNKR